MTNLLIAIVISFLFGLIMALLIIAYVNFGEKVQEWSDSYSNPKRWTRRIIHFTAMIFVVIVTFYGFLFYVSLVITSLKEITNNYNLFLIFFILCESLLIFPFILLRKKIFRQGRVKKLWQS